MKKTYNFKPAKETNSVAETPPRAAESAASAASSTAPKAPAQMCGGPNYDLHDLIQAAVPMFREITHFLKSLESRPIGNLVITFAKPEDKNKIV